MGISYERGTPIDPTVSHFVGACGYSHGHVHEFSVHFGPKIPLNPAELRGGCALRSFTNEWLGLEAIFSEHCPLIASIAYQQDFYVCKDLSPYRFQANPRTSLRTNLLTSTVLPDALQCDGCMMSNVMDARCTPPPLPSHPSTLENRPEGAPGIILLQGPIEGQFLMSEVPLKGRA